MKILILVLLLLPNAAYCKDFRDAEWGISKSELKNIEKSELIKEQDDRLIYSDVFIVYSVGIIYQFFDNKLIWGSYKFADQYQDKEKYLREFLDFNAVLTNKYGEPKKFDEWKNKNSKFKDDTASAIEAGDLVLWRAWETNTSLIKLTIYGHNNKFNIETYYFSKNYKDKASKLIQDLQQDKF
ncbi:MAG: hypothetical protein ACRENO_02775 [Thermodesulfobacteriota bacterium]